jgi:hypothetical protein
MCVLIIKEIKRLKINHKSGLADAVSWLHGFEQLYHWKELVGVCWAVGCPPIQGQFHFFHDSLPAAAE